MRVWQVIYPADGVGASRGEATVEFAATKREAAWLAREGGGDYRPVVVPRRKAELIRFLNEEVVG